MSLWHSQREQSAFALDVRLAFAVFPQRGFQIGTIEIAFGADVDFMERSMDEAGRKRQKPLPDDADPLG